MYNAMAGGWNNQPQPPQGRVKPEHVPRLTLWVMLPMEGYVGMLDDHRRRVLLCEEQSKYRRTTMHSSVADVAQLAEQ